MRTGHIGSLEVSAIGLGCNNFGRALDQEGSTVVVNAALDAGITYFDTASNYGNGQSERFLGVALGARRDEVIIGTKFGMGRPDMDGSTGARPETVRAQCEHSLAELGTEVIDLYQLHKPDPDTPIEDTLGAMSELVDAGKVREIGCSNLDAMQLTEALEASESNGFARFVSNQIHWSMVHREPETSGLADLAEGEAVALLPFYPLASGLLTGKSRPGAAQEGRLQMERYAHFLTDENYALVDRLRAYAAARGISPATVALGWLLAQPAVPSVTPGATRPEQILANVEAAAWHPTPADLAELDRVLDG